MARERRQQQKKKKIEILNKLAPFLYSFKFPLLLIAIAFVPRLIALIGLSDSPIFNHPVIDSRTYHPNAVEIAPSVIDQWIKFSNSIL